MRMYNPPHPGEIIKEFWLDEKLISLNKLAKHLDVCTSTLSRVVNGKSDISPEMALRLSKVLGRSPESWLEMQNQYSLWKVAQNIKLEHLHALQFA